MWDGSRGRWHGWLTRWPPRGDRGGRRRCGTGPVHSVAGLVVSISMDGRARRPRRHRRLGLFPIAVTRCRNRYRNRNDRTDWPSDSADRPGLAVPRGGSDAHVTASCARPAPCAGPARCARSLPDSDRRSPGGGAVRALACGVADRSPSTRSSSARVTRPIWIGELVGSVGLSVCGPHRGMQRQQVLAPIRSITGFDHPDAAV